MGKGKFWWGAYRWQKAFVRSALKDSNPFRHVCVCRAPLIWQEHHAQACVCVWHANLVCQVHAITSKKLLILNVWYLLKNTTLIKMVFTTLGVIAGTLLYLMSLKFRKLFKKNLNYKYQRYYIIYFKQTS